MAPERPRQCEFIPSVPQWTKGNTVFRSIFGSWQRYPRCLVRLASRQSFSRKTPRNLPAGKDRRRQEKDADGLGQHIPAGSAGPRSTGARLPPAKDDAAGMRSVRISNKVFHLKSVLEQ